MRLTSSPLLVRLFNWWHGSRVRRSGPGHRVVSSNARLRGTRMEFYGRDGVVEIGRDVRLFDCTIILRGTAPRLVIGEGSRLIGVRMVVEDRGSRLLIGPVNAMTGAVLQAKEGGLVEIGTGCMIGSGVEVTNSDSHSLLDRTTGERINPARDVIIGDHVWLTAGVWVSKGSRIGTGTVVAARSRVVGELPPDVLAAGSPAIPKRTGVRWDRNRLGVEP